MHHELAVKLIVFSQLLDLIFTLKIYIQIL